MPTLGIPAPLRAYTGGQKDLILHGNTVREVMQDLGAQYPALKMHLFTSEGDLRPFVNLFLGDKNVKDRQGLQIPLEQNAHLRLILSIAGGNGPGM
jgi:molybdopterin converting factor small subunit